MVIYNQKEKEKSHRKKNKKIKKRVDKIKERCYNKYNIKERKEKEKRK